MEVRVKQLEDKVHTMTTVMMLMFVFNVGAAYFMYDLYLTMRPIVELRQSMRGLFK
jgi:hypothetical protein